MDKNLIFDIGFHKGEDTKYYLEKGYKVVAVEANPMLTDYGKLKFKNYIENGQLILLNIGIANENKILDFWVNDYCSEWSSFDKEIGCRSNTKCHKIEVECIRTEDLINKYGLPYYLKIDIEGYDIHAVESLNRNSLPKYISCEAVYVDWLFKLKELGYSKFKVINQADRFKELKISKEKSKLHHYKRYLINGIMHRTSDFIDWKFPIKSSGPFGEDTDGAWKSADEVALLFKEHFQFEKNIPLSTISWFDFHATY